MIFIREERLGFQSEPGSEASFMLCLRRTTTIFLEHKRKRCITMDPFTVGQVSLLLSSSGADPKESLESLVYSHCTLFIKFSPKCNYLKSTGKICIHTVGGRIQKGYTGKSLTDNSRQITSSFYAVGVSRSTTPFRPTSRNRPTSLVSTPG